MNIKRKIDSFVKCENKIGVLKEKLARMMQSFWGKFSYKSYGKNSLIKSPDRIIGKKCVSIGDNVTILHHMRMEVISKWKEQTFNPAIIIKDNVSIGQNFHIVAANELIIGSNTTISGNVFITDNNHDYRQIGEHILEQPLLVDKTEIGENCFIGYGAAIQAGTVLGKQCIVGTNAVVRGVFEDYSVIVGAPARVVKKYNVDKGQWEKVK